MQARDQYEPDLIKARETVELLKAAELRDYFRDDCVDAARSRVTRHETVFQGAVIVYPILLPEGTELPVSLPTGLKRLAVPMGANALMHEVRGFRQKLEERTTGEYLPHAQRQYDRLVRSLETEELRDELFTIMPIASHGRFERDIAKTFPLPFNDKLRMERFDQFVALCRFRDEPLELLALSACETATGDDRAALGLAGVAVKAGARSALVALWHIDDRASSTLIAEFYQLREPSVSRGIALQRAQLKLPHDPRYQHPGYWSPFWLINNRL
jgi:CHAT domain-containing protein